MLFLGRWIILLLAINRFKLIAMKRGTKRKPSHVSASRTASHNDLRTLSQDALSSQASIYSQQSQKSQTQRSAWAGEDYEEYEDIIVGDQPVSISPEEQKRIQTVLQFARKGKITQGNAFEIPVRVLDPQLSENGLRFWKFASQLLSASMSIYDKRVQNMFQNTHRMFDSLVRAQTTNNEQPEDRDRRQRAQLLKMDVEQFAKQGVVGYQAAQQNLEQGEKINIRNLRSQCTDPLLHQRLKAFDSNSLEGLFVNACSTDSTHLLNLFPAKQLGKQMTSQEVQIEQKERQKKAQSQEIPHFIRKELSNLQILAQSVNIYQGVEIFRRQNIRSNEPADESFMLQIANFIKNPISQDRIQNHQTNSPYNFQFHSQQQTQLEESTQTQIRPLSSQYHTLSHKPSTQFHPQSEFYMDIDDLSCPAMSPWQLQFKGSKLQRKKRPRFVNHHSMKQSRTRQQPEIDFLDQKHTTRKEVMRSKIAPPISKIQRTGYIDINLAPNSMDPFLVVRKKRRQQIGYHQNQAEQIPITANYLLPPPIEKQQPMDIEQQPVPFEETFQNNPFSLNTQTNTYTNKESSWQRGGVIRNIRQLKERIFDSIQGGGSVKLSQIDMQVSPSSILVVFLHLVNEKHLIVESIDEESDILISLRSE